MRTVNGSNNYCVYIHINKINDKKYIGITCRNPEDRWGLNGAGYKKEQSYFYKAIQKYGWDNFEHIIWADNLFEYEAKSIEVALIDTYKTNVCRWHDEAQGYNMTDGGEGTKGCVLSEETRKKMSQSRMGRQVSEETRKKISNGHKGKHLSESTRKKLSEINIGKYAGAKNPSARAVYQINKDTNEIIARFETMQEASSQTGASRPHICCCCRGTRNVAGGFKWVYADNKAEDEI